MSDAATPATGPADAPASSDNSMASVLAEFAQDTSAPKEDAVSEAVRELTEQSSESDAEAPDVAEREVETPEAEAEASEESNPAEEPTNEPDASARYTVKVNGEDHKVTFAELKAGYSRTEDYKAKTMALADDRRALDTERGGYEAKYADQLKQATDLFVAADPLLSQADKIDWPALAREDPAAYAQLQAEIGERMRVVNGARAEIERVAGEQAQATEAAQAEGLKEAETAIRASDPAFADDAAFQAHVSTGVTALRDAGFDASDIMAVMSDPKAAPAALSIVADAMKWREQAKTRASLPEKRVVQAPAKPLKSDASEGSQPRKAPASNASRDAKVNWAVDELLSQGI